MRPIWWKGFQFHSSKRLYLISLLYMNDIQIVCDRERMKERNRKRKRKRWAYRKRERKGNITDL